MTVSKSTAEIFDMEDARARRRASDLPGAEFPNAGAHLAAVRETANYSLSEISEKTHIKQHHIEAIENLDIDALPGRPYAIGFVKTYAEFLGLDAQGLVDRFKEDAGYSAPPAPPVEEFEAAEAAIDTEGRELSLAAVIAIILFFIWCAYQITLISVERDAPAPAIAPVGSGAINPGAVIDGDVANAVPASADIVEARIIDRIEPIYPRGCLNDAAAMETVIVAFHISALGRVGGERVAQSSNACFEASALNAVRRWRFEPGKINGEARPVFDQKYSFSFERPR